MTGAAYLGGGFIFLGMLIAETGARVVPQRGVSESP